MKKGLRELLNDVVKSILMYRLKEFNFKVKKNEANVVEYYRGFWTDRDNFTYNVKRITSSVDYLVNSIIMDKCKERVVQIENVGCDITWHPDMCEYYYNVYIAFGGY